MDPFYLTRQSFGPEIKIAGESLLVNPDIDYLNQAIENIDSFAINPLFLSKTFQLEYLKSFSTNRLNKTIFEYKPIIENVEYRFPDQIQTINQQKFEKINRVKVDLENKIIVPNQYFNRSPYRYYVDETASRPKPINREMSHYDLNDWLKDAAGTDDPETMNDVYWNLD